MPATRLGSDPVTIRRFDVVAIDSQAVGEFLQHVGLSADVLVQARRGDSVRFDHMGPGLARGEIRGPIHATGSASLTIDEIYQINVFVDERDGEYKAHQVTAHRQYVIRPYRNPETAPDGTVKCWRYSCAGFVIDAYRDAGIDLMTTDEASLPQVTLETLAVAYPNAAPLLHRRRGDFGLDGNGPWPVVLAGYVLNALDRAPEETRLRPYTPAAGDEYFPSRRGSLAASPG